MEIEAKALASYLEKDFPLSIKSKVSVNKSFDRYSIPLLSVQIAEESFSCPLEIKNVKEGPEIDFNLSSQNLSIDTLLGILSTRSKTPSPKPKPGEITKNVKASIKSLSDTLKVKGNIDIQNAIFQKLKIDRFKANLTLAGKKVWLKLKDVSGYGGTLSMDGRINLAALTYEIKPLNLKGFNAGPFVNDYIDSFMPKQLNMKNKAEGKLDIFLSLSGRGVEMPAVFDKVKIDGVAVLTKGRLKNIKSLENIAEKYNISFLKQDLLVKGLRAEMELKNRILTVKDLDLRDTDVEVAFKGDLDYNTMEYKPGNRLTLKLSPSVSKELPKEFSVFKDDRGFVNLDFELQGSLSAPIPSPRLEKPIEKAVGKLKIKIEAKKIELEQKAKEEAQKEAEKLKKKAEEKIKKILKY